ncbi:MAG: cupin domain-containing protein [Muribaculaceae bacterium]|nr:cupin domain-containing protein [Muribaculaceae bacterium]
MLNTEFKFGEVQNLTSQIEPDNKQVKFERIFENTNGGVSLLAFKAGQKLDEHVAPAEVMVCVLEGEIEFTMVDNPHTIKAGEFMLMGAGVPHSVIAKADSKVALIKVKP